MNTYVYVGDSDTCLFCGGTGLDPDWGTLDCELCEANGHNNPNCPNCHGAGEYETQFVCRFCEGAKYL